MRLPEGVPWAGIFFFSLCIFGFLIHPFNIRLPQRDRSLVSPECLCSSQPKNWTCETLPGAPWRPLSEVLHSPKHIPPYEKPPCLLADEWLQSPREHGRPEFSIILTVFNKEELLPRILGPILELTTESWELVVVFDGCKDNSIEVAMQTLHEYGCLPTYSSTHRQHRKLGDAAPQAANSSSGSSSRPPRPPPRSSCINPGLVHVRLIKQPTEIWETSANNLGMRASVGRWWMLLQDDQLLLEEGWNTAMALPLRQFPDAFAVTARCAHHKFSYYGIDRGLPNKMVDRGRCTPDSLERPLLPTDLVPGQCNFHVRDTANRGPLLLDGHKMAALGYLDEQNVLLEDDDHDLMLRAWVQHKWVVGSVEVNFTMPWDWGGRRQKKLPPRTRDEERYREARKARANTTFMVGLIGTDAHPKDDPARPWPDIHDEERPLPDALCERFNSPLLGQAQGSSASSAGGSGAGGQGGGQQPWWVQFAAGAGKGQGKDHEGGGGQVGGVGKSGDANGEGGGSWVGRAWGDVRAWVAERLPHAGHRFSWWRR